MSQDIRENSYEPAYKSAPIVALYWLLKRLLTYWFMRDVLPTLLMMVRLDEWPAIKEHN